MGLSQFECRTTCGEQRIDVIQIGRSAIAFATSADTICFIGIDDGNCVINHYRLTDHIVDGVRCDGLRCMAGHRNESILAISEMSCVRRIILLAYPSLQCMATFSSGTGARQTPELSSSSSSSPFYQSIQFSETEHVIALTSFPDYQLEVWNWRTRTLLLAQPTQLYHYNQFIR